jgi:hypothetical protein
MKGHMFWIERIYLILLKWMTPVRMHKLNKAAMEKPKKKLEKNYLTFRGEKVVLHVR